MKNFKFRAEAMDDAVELLRLITKHHIKHLQSYTITSMNVIYAGIVVDLVTDFNKEELIDLMKLVDDGHVMRQTLEKAENYTGERNFAID